MKFIGQQEDITFARRKGSKDVKPRKKRMGQIAAGVGTLAAGAAALKNRKGIATAAKAGIRSARRTAGTAGGTAKLGAMAAGDAASAGKARVGSAVSGLRQTANKFEQRGRDVMASKKASGQKKQNASTQQQKYRLMMGGRR